MFDPQTMFDPQMGTSEMISVTATCISAAWKSSVLLLLAGALALMLSRRSAAMRHLAWTTALAGALAIPLMESVLPAWQLPAAAKVTSTVASTRAAEDSLVVPSNRVTHSAESSVAMLEGSALERTVVDEASAADQAHIAEQIRTGISVANSRPSPMLPAGWLLSAWLVGTIGMLVRLAVGIAALKRLEMRSVRPADEALSRQLADVARQLGLVRRVRLLLSDDRAIPMTWGTIRPVLLLPREAQNWPADRLRIVLLHELVHVARCDYLFQLVGALARAVYWFNPLAWWGYRQLKVELEQACDDRVLSLGTQAETYAFELLHITSQFPIPGYTPSAALAIGRSARIQRRIETILDPSQNRVPMTRRLACTASLIAFAFTLAIASMHEARGQAVSETQPAADTATAPSNAKQTPPPIESKLADTSSAVQAGSADSKAAAGVNSFTDAPPVANTDRLSEVRKQILKSYAKSPDERALDEGAIRGMLQSLDDPHSEFLSGDKLKELERVIEGMLTGIGVEVSTSEKQLVIINPIPGSPAHAAGLKSGDAILAVDGKTVEEQGPAAAINAIRGTAGSVVSLRVKRAGGQEFTQNVTRGAIRLPSVKGLWVEHDPPRNWHYWLDEEQKLGYVQIAEFGKQTVDDCQAAVKALLSEGLKGLVLDLRHCPGGLLVASVGVAELFLREGTIVSIKGEQAPELTWRAAGNNFLGDFPLLVLVDEHTASAAEILAGALKNGRATVLGTRTFGKGSVQSILPVDGDGAIRLTTAYFYLAGGRSIDRQKGADRWGVDPTDGFFVPLSSEQHDRWLKSRPNWNIYGPDLRARNQGSKAISAALEGVLADPQLAAAYQSFSARVAGGAFLKVGQPLQALRDQLARREQLLKARAEAQKQLETIEKELSSTSGGTGGK